MAESQSTQPTAALDEIGDEILMTAAVLHGPLHLASSHVNRHYYEGYIAGLCFARQCIEAMD